MLVIIADESLLIALKSLCLWLLREMPKAIGRGGREKRMRRLFGGINSGFGTSN